MKLITKIDLLTIKAIKKSKLMRIKLIDNTVIITSIDKIDKWLNGLYTNEYLLCCGETIYISGNDIKKFDKSFINYANIKEIAFLFNND